MAGRPTLTGGTSRAHAVTSGLVLTRAGTVARVLETRAPETHASVTRVPAVIHAMAAVVVVIPVRARAPARGRIPPLARVTFQVHAGAAFRTPAWILASARSGPKVPTRARGAVRAHAGLRRLT